ncbi:MAG: HD domain-containing protein, partial [Herpetosiphon sp.]|nr:HD domain-containing protein [Herpetosiphon sp.]
MKTIIEAVADFVQQRLTAVGTANDIAPNAIQYRWEHTLRVTTIGQQLARDEHANEQHVVLGCLLHDVATLDHGDYRDHGRLGAQISRPFLRERGLNHDDVEAICYAIAVHVDGKANFEHEPTLEASIVSDADNIDRFGAYRLLEWGQPFMDDYATLISKARERITVLQNYRVKQIMETAAG